MQKINSAFINALLADATYALKINNWENQGFNLASTLQDRMTPTLANYIGEHYTVITHIDTDDNVISTGSGFDATVWKDNSNGKLYVSMTGTEGGQEFISDANLAVGRGAFLQNQQIGTAWLA